MKNLNNGSLTIDVNRGKDEHAMIGWLKLTKIERMGLVKQKLMSN